MTRSRRSSSPEAHSQPSAAPFRRWRAALLLFCLAMVVRLIYLGEDAGSPFFGFRGIDSAEYHDMALRFGEGAWPGSEAFFWAPLYPLFLGVLYKLLGHGLLVAKLVQAVVGSASCVLIYLIGRRLFRGRFVPPAAGVACAVYGTLIYFDGQLLSGVLDVFLQLLTVLLLLRAAGSGRIAWWMAGGLCIGLAAVNRGGILLLLPPVVLWMYMLSRHRWLPANNEPDRTGRLSFFKSVAALVVPVVLVIFPVTWHNVRYDHPEGWSETRVLSRASVGQSVRRLATGRFAPIAANLGLNFYLGNHWELRDINNVNHPDCFTYYRRIKDQPFEDGVRTASGGSRYLIAQTLVDIGRAPLDWLKLMGVKVFRLFNGAEIPRNSNLYADRQYSLILSGLLWKQVVAFPSGLVIPLGLLGIVLVRRCWRVHFVLLACLAVQGLFVLAFFVTARYRLPSLPLLVLYGAFAVETLAGQIRLRAYSKLAVSATAAAALLIFCNIRIGKMDSAHGAYEHYNLATALTHHGRAEEAVVHFTEALRIDPDYGDAHVNLGKVLFSQGKFDDAIAHYQRAIQVRADFYEAHYNFGTALESQGKLDEAKAHYLEAVRINPDFDRAHNNLGVILARQENWEAAIVHLSEALRINPDLARAHNNLGNVLSQQGKVSEAISHYYQAVRIRPGYAMAHYNLGDLLATQGRIDEAIHHLSEAIRLRPDLGAARDSLRRAVGVRRQQRG